MENVSVERREGVLRAVGIGVLVAGILASLRVWPAGGGDFLSYYLMGDAVLNGVNIYEAGPRAEMCRRLGFVSPVGMFYPPATGFVLAPFALFPYAIAKDIWFLLLNLAVIFGVRALVRLAAPNAKPHVWMIAAGGVLFSAGIRWGMMLSQCAPLLLGLLCYQLVALHTKRPGLSLAIAAFATAFKMTLAVPFLGLLALHRRYLAGVVSVAVWAGLNALAFWRLGGSSALSIYVENMSSLDALDDATNVNMPDPWSGVSLPRTDFVYLFYGVSGNLPASRLVALACCGATALFLLYQGMRVKTPPTLEDSALFVGPLVCLGSLAVYHHQYDLCLFFVPFLLVLFRPELARGVPAWVLVLPLAAMIAVLPIGVTQNFLVSLVGPQGFAWLKLAFPVAVILALVGMCALLARALRGLPLRFTWR